MSTLESRKRSNESSFSEVLSPRKKLSSIIARVNSFNDNKLQREVTQHSSNHNNGSEANDSYEYPSTEKPIVQEAYKSEDSIQRNRRLLAGIMGHLGSAKKRLDHDSKAIEKQTSIVNSVYQKHSEEGKKIAEMKRRRLELERKREMMMKERIRLRQKLQEIEKQKEIFLHSQEKLKFFIATSSTDPPLYWLPCSHNETTTQLLSDHVLSISKAIAEREVSDDKLLSPVQARLQELDEEESNLEEVDDADDADDADDNNFYNDSELKNTDENEIDDTHEDPDVENNGQENSPKVSDE